MLIDVDIVGDAGVAFLTESIVQVARAVSRTTPMPRWSPFFRLDMRRREPPGLEAFSRHGIFRKYEHVLIVGCGLGGAARWWTLGFGCTVVGVDVSASVIRAATVLSRRSGLQGRAQFQTGRAAALPLQSGHFTHVWLAHDLRETPDAPAALREAYRVIRPGGSCAGILGPAHATPVTPSIEPITAAGFVGVQVDRLATGETSSAFDTALRQLRAIVERDAPSGLRTVLLDTLARARADALDETPVLQFVAQRPS